MTNYIPDAVGKLNTLWQGAIYYG